MNQYELLGVVGKGQYGVAYKARHKHDNQFYCIKKIPMSAKDDQKASLKEAQLLSTLDHPNVIAYKETFVDADESICIVTSFCEEGDLFTSIRKAADQDLIFSENEVMDMFLQIASALMYIHSKKILHRDLKTQNIFIARGGIIVLGDFGISKVLAQTADFATTFTGTPYYMAPEICTNQPYTFKSDIWSLGCVLYEMCTLKHAFAADNFMSLVYQIVRGDFPPIPTDKFSTGLSDLVNSLLMRDTAARPSLQQMFQMPYVHAHVQRFHGEERQRLQRQAATLTRRKDAMLKTVQEAKSLSINDNFESLTPRQKKERKKEMENKKRELELQIASMNMQKDKTKVAERRAQIVHHSNIGLSGGHHYGAQPHPSGFYDQTTDSVYGASVNLGTMNGLSSMNGAGGGGGSTMGDSMVNLGTMPGMHTSQSSPAGMDRPDSPSQSQWMERTKPSSATASRLSSVRQSQYEDSPLPSPLRASGIRPLVHDERPVGGRSMQATIGGGDTVLLGSVVDPGSSMYGIKTAGASGQTRPLSGQRPSTSGSTRRESGSGAGGETLGCSMVNLDTMPSGSGRFSGIFKPGALNPAASSELRSSGGALPPFMGRSSQGTSAVLGGTGPSGGGGDHRLSNSVAIPIKATPSTSFDFAARPAAQQPSNSYSRNKSSRNPINSRVQDEHDKYEDDFDDYEDDFEQYNPEDEQEIVNQRMKILNNVEEMERSMGDSFDESGTAAMQERVGATQRNSKAALMRLKCQTSLGATFGPVYGYLKDVRSCAKAPDEKEVQKKLRAMVGNNNTMLQGCFLVDQLVFQEAMYR